jgi:hypothetical protein
MPRRIHGMVCPSQCHRSNLGWNLDKQ